MPSPVAPTFVPSTIDEFSGSLAAVPMLSNGQWVHSASSRRANVYNPSTGQVIATVPLATTGEIDQVVQVAAAAQPAWAATPVVERCRLLFRFRELLSQRFDEVARLVTREHGKTLTEARSSVQRGLEVVEFACGIPSLLMGQSLPDIARGVDCETIRQPVGVCVGITPFNFPAMVPLWMFPVALACGNTFILKPSEKVPLTANLLGQIMVDAGCPAGVFNIAHGDKQAVDALLRHELVSAVSFVGSTSIAKYVYETGARHGKRVQSAGGAKNHLIIMPDADLHQAAAALQASAFGCAGERCMAGSVAVPVGDIGDRLVDLLCERATAMTVGPTDTGADVDMGPVISADHRKRIAGYLDEANGQGASVALDGRQNIPSGAGFFLRPSVVDRADPGMKVVTDEIFGPVLSVIRAKSLDEALAVGRQSPYGNGASIFTSSGYAAREFRQHFNAGMIGINVGVPAPMAWFPFTGWNQSFFGDLHVQGLESIQFFTRQKTITTRWFANASEAAHDPVWRQK